MDALYRKLRDQARQIVKSLPTPAFFQDLAQELTESRVLLESDPLLTGIARAIQPDLDDDFGHGIRHTTLVCIDAGAIVLRELSKHPGAPEDGSVTRQIVLVQAAGLLHDIRRKQPNHAHEGSVYAAGLLPGHALTPGEIELISRAIREHEAFAPEGPNQDPNSRSLISDALYDADKFRWGPDNFTHTLWDMVMFTRLPFKEFAQKYPGGMHKLSLIRDTFRTDTGKHYGPEMIDLGIETGNRLLAILKTDYPSFF